MLQFYCSSWFPFGEVKLVEKSWQFVMWFHQKWDISISKFQYKLRCTELLCTSSIHIRAMQYSHLWAWILKIRTKLGLDSAHIVMAFFVIQCGKASTLIRQLKPCSEFSAFQSLKWIIFSLRLLGCFLCMLWVMICCIWGVIGLQEFIKLKTLIEQACKRGKWSLWNFNQFTWLSCTRNT